MIIVLLTLFTVPRCFIVIFFNKCVICSGAMIINGWMKLESEVLQGGMNFTAESEAVIDFKTDVDFSNMPFKMCLQMMRPPLQYK